MPKKVKINRGDSWIKVANDNGISLNDLLYWNGVDPMSREALPAINPDQELYISDPYRLQSSFVQAQAPRDYVNFGDGGRQLIDNYALAVKQGAMSLNQVPDVYKTAVYQRGITMSTNEAANIIAKVGFNIGAFMLDPIGYTLSAGAQKGLAYANDRISGRNEYNAGDLLKYTPIQGRDYAERHPFRAAVIDAVSGVLGGAALRNIPQWMQYISQNGVRGLMQNAVATTGAQRQTLMYPGKQMFGTVFQSGSKGASKTGTVVAGNAGGYHPISGVKGIFNNQASGNATQWIKPDGTLPIVPGLPFTPVTGPIYWQNQPERKVTLAPVPQRHIYEQQSFNRWQLPNPTGEISVFQPGTGNFVLTGHAPIGNTVDQQALTNESIRLYNNDYAPRISTYVNGSIEGTPSNIHSGLGIIWGSENPGNLIIK